MCSVLTGVNGVDVIQENLRQMCVFKIATAANKIIWWWRYAEEFYADCVKKADFTKECSEAAMKKVSGLAVKDVAQCVKDSGGADYHADVENSLIEHEMRLARLDGIYDLPTVIINSATFQDSLECRKPFDSATCPVFHSICSRFLEKNLPAVCAPSKGCLPGQTRDVCNRCVKIGSPEFILDKSQCPVEGPPTTRTHSYTHSSNPISCFYSESYSFRCVGDRHIDISIACSGDRTARVPQVFSFSSSCRNSRDHGPVRP